MSGLSELNHYCLGFFGLVIGDSWACLLMPICFVRSPCFALYMELLSSHLSSNVIAEVKPKIKSELRVSLFSLK